REVEEPRKPSPGDRKHPRRPALPQRPLLQAGRYSPRRLPDPAPAGRVPGEPPLRRDLAPLEGLTSVRRLHRREAGEGGARPGEVRRLRGRPQGGLQHYGGRRIPRHRIRLPEGLPQDLGHRGLFDTVNASMEHRTRQAATALAACWVALTALPAKAAVVINEVFYHAPGGAGDLQYVELHNAGEGVVELEGWKFAKGIE